MNYPIETLEIDRALFKHLSIMHENDKDRTRYNDYKSKLDQLDTAIRILTDYNKGRL